MKHLFVICSLVFITWDIAWGATPSRVVDLQASATNGGVVLTWSAPAPSISADLDELDVRYSTTAINTLNWSACSRVLWLTDPGVSGTVQSAVVAEELIPYTLYYFSIRVKDTSGGWSSPSPSKICSTGGNEYGVSLVWDLLPDTNVVSYIGSVGQASRTYDIVTNVGFRTSVRFERLQYGVTYYFAAQAADWSGLTSDWSEEITYRRPK
jgi:hypothetical protein